MASTQPYNNKVPSGYKAGQMQQFTPEQMDLFKRSFAQVDPNSYLAKLAGGDQSQFAEMEAPALRQFQGLQGQIASRFSGRGLGGQRSSGFQNTMNQASSDFAQSLQSRRMDLQRQAMLDLMNMSNSLLNQRPYENYMIKKQKQAKPNYLGGALGGLLGGVGGFFAGGPMGALSGAGLGYGIGSGGGTGGQQWQGDTNQDWAYNLGDYFSPGI